jgi:hypothetical protein
VAAQHPGAGDRETSLCRIASRDWPKHRNRGRSSASSRTKTRRRSSREAWSEEETAKLVVTVHNDSQRAVSRMVRAPQRHADGWPPGSAPRASRNRWFADSPLEGAGFEPSVPLRWCAGSRPVRSTSFGRIFPRKDRRILSEGSTFRIPLPPPASLVRTRFLPIMDERSEGSACR